MIQFYFLSILMNAVTGGILAADDDVSEGTGNRFLPAFLERETPRLVLGIGAMLTGFFKLLSPSQGDLPIIGDFVPAAAGLIAGFVLVFDFYWSRSSLEDERTEHFASLIGKNKRFIGFAALASAALHFLFPRVLFL